MKSILCPYLLFSCLFVCGRELKLSGTLTYPCIDTLLKNETVLLCADNKSYCFQNFVASFENDRLFITASRPDSSTLFPIFNLFVITKRQTGIYSSGKQTSDVYGSLRGGGGHDVASNVHNGSCQVTLSEFSSEHVKGSFVMTAFDPWGSKGKLISGSFYIKFKKD